VGSQIVVLGETGVIPADIDDAPREEGLLLASDFGELSIDAMVEGHRAVILRSTKFTQRNPCLLPDESVDPREGVGVSAVIVNLTGSHQSHLFPDFGDIGFEQIPTDHELVTVNMDREVVTTLPLVAVDLFRVAVLNEKIRESVVGVDDPVRHRADHNRRVPRVERINRNRHIVIHSNLQKSLSNKYVEVAIFVIAS